MPSHEPTHGSGRGACTNAVGFSAAGGAGLAGGNAGSSTGGGGSGSSIVSAGFSEGVWAKAMTRARSGGGGSAGRGDAPVNTSQTAARARARLTACCPSSRPASIPSLARSFRRLCHGTSHEVDPPYLCDNDLTIARNNPEIKLADQLPKDADPE